jgi:hypothetical protein
MAKRPAKPQDRRAGAAGKRTAAKTVAARAVKKSAARPAPARASVAPVARKPKPVPIPARKAPGLDRARRTIEGDDDLVSMPPSSLDMDRSASAARSGRQTLKHRRDSHNETSPALTGGDVDADWESAYSVGDEAPGGDNPTPDQDIVDDIGKALGVQYEDNEELKGEKKISDRDRQRWELDPASSEDYEDRD